MLIKDNIKGVFFGNTAIKAVYLGSILLWSAGPYLFVKPERPVWIEEGGAGEQLQVESNADWMIE